MKKHFLLSGLGNAAATIGLLSLVPLLVTLIKTELFDMSSQVQGWSESLLALFVGGPAFALALIFYALSYFSGSPEKTDDTTTDENTSDGVKQEVDS